ncbi:MAG: redoxin domain-containing protein [Planctomycetales bacterium]|nr:redoxin domain-containing protein [Planctomycetales bacterium]
MKTRLSVWLACVVVCGTWGSMIGCSRSVDSTASSSASVHGESVGVSGATADAASTRMAPNEPNQPSEPTVEVVPSDPIVELTPLDPPPESLSIGDAYPGLAIAKWIKGEPVALPLQDKVHVVEFWATWCGPCRSGMPHISELQHEFADDVTFIGVTREKEQTVRTFLTANSPDGRTWDEVVQYRLALDDRDWTNQAYMRAAGRNGIPCAFVVGRDGVIDWIGHPASIDQPLREIVDGTWDRDAALAEFKRQQRLAEVSRRLAEFAQSKDWDSALQLLDEIESEVGASNTLLNRRLQLLQLAGRHEEASQVRNQLVEAAWEDAFLLNEVAWAAATSEQGADLELALRAAERASELRNHEDGNVLDTVARCYYELGKLDEAIAWQQKAVEHTSGNPQIQQALERYTQEKEASTPESESDPE